MIAPLSRVCINLSFCITILVLLGSQFGLTASPLTKLHDRLVVVTSSRANQSLVDSLLHNEPALGVPLTELRLEDETVLVYDLGNKTSADDISMLRRRLVSDDRISSITQGYGGAQEQLFPTNRLIIKFNEEIRSDRVASLCDSLNVSIVRSFSWLSNGYTVTISKEVTDPIILSETIESLNEIEFCQPNFIRLFRPNGILPNDSLFSLQWDANNSGFPLGVAGADTKALAGWEYARGSEAITVAIIDEGVDTTHEDLAGKIVDQYDATDNDDEQQPNSWDGHGTACAGVAAAISDNQHGVAGIARQCSLMPVRIAYKASPLPVLWVTSDEIIANGITTAVDRGADVLSISWGLTYSSALIHSAISYAKTTGRDGKGCVIVCSSGNSDMNAILYPAAYSETIAVGATNEWDERKSKTTQDGETTWGSNYGAELNVVAPGVHIWTTDIMGSGGYNTTGNPDYGDPSGNYWNKFTGTSAAAPHVAGLAGLILSLDPTLSSDSVQALIENTADDQVGSLSEDMPGWDQYMGYGRINIFGAVEQLSTVQYVGGTIDSNTVWDSTKVRRVEETVTVPNGIALTIEPGTIIKFDYVPLAEGSYERNKLIAEGPLIAEGASNAPIYFTSVRDDQLGGDTNGDSSFTAPAPGDWGYVSIGNSLSTFRHCVMRYGGVGSFTQVGSSPPFYQDKQLLLIDGIATGLSIDSCLFEKFAVEGGSETEPAKGISWVTNDQFESDVSLSGNVIIDGEAGIEVRFESPGGGIQCVENQLSNLTGNAIECFDITSSSIIRKNGIDNVATGLIVNSSAPGLLIDSNLISNVINIGIQLEKVEGHVTDNSLEQSDSTLGLGTGLDFSNGSNIYVDGNIISQFATGIRSESGALNTPSLATIQLNQITGNNSYGIYLGSNDTTAYTGPNVTINHNDLHANESYNLYLGDYRNPSGTTIDARNNWWGSAEPATILNSIHDHADDNGSPQANINPYRFGSVFAPEGILALDQPELKFALFPDSQMTAQLWLYNQSLEWQINFGLTNYPAWLHLSPTSGAIPTDDSLLINVTVDGSGLTNAIYSESFEIYSSDPLANPKSVPVTLQVSSVFLETPDGGEIFNSGQTQIADWVLVDSTEVDSVRVWFSSDGGESYPDLLTITTSPFSQTGWTVPVLATDSARLLVEAFWTSGLTGVDESDSTFSIGIGPYVCGQYANGFTGNTNCDTEGKRNLADLTRLIDRVYLSRTLLCNEGEGNIDGDLLDKLNLSDITRLIDHVYLSKQETAPCN